MSLKNYNCDTIPTHFEICPSSTNLLNTLCKENNIFISHFVKLESQFLLQEKLYLCGKQDKTITMKNMKDLHNRLRYLFSESQLSYHQTHLDVITYTSVEEDIITILDDKIKDMPSLIMDKDKLCSNLNNCT